MESIGIRREALEFILGVSGELYPREFVGMLRAEGDLITEILVIPASIYGEGFAHTKSYMVPLDRSIIGSVHSHPGSSYSPSKRDLIFFGKHGRVHLIARHPYSGLVDVACYLNDGTRLTLVLVE